MERYNKETVVLETREGTAHNKTWLKEVWKQRIIKYFPYYKLKSVKFEKEKGDIR